MRVDQVPPSHGGISLADRLETRVTLTKKESVNMKLNNEGKIVIEVKHGVSSDGSLTGRYYMASLNGWTGEGLTEADAVRDVHQSRAEALTKLHHNNRVFGTRLNFEVVS